MTQPATVTYIGKDTDGVDITAKVVPASGDGLVPDSPVYGDARRESRRRIEDAKQRTKGSKTPLQRKRKRQ